MCRLHKGAMSGDPDIADMGEMNPPFSTERADHGRKIVFGVGSQGTGAKGPAVAGMSTSPISRSKLSWDVMILGKPKINGSTDFPKATRCLTSF